MDNPFWQKCGTHPLIVAYNAKCAEVDELQRQIREAESAARKDMPRPKYRCVGAYRDKHETDVEAYCFVLDLANEDEKRAWMDVWGSIEGMWEEGRGTCAYYVVNGVLLHRGGGWIVFKDGLVLTDDEWAAIKRGEIPDRVRPDWIVK